jgi:hypothetical protein
MITWLSRGNQLKPQFLTAHLLFIKGLRTAGELQTRFEGNDAPLTVPLAYFSLCFFPATHRFPQSIMVEDFFSSRLQGLTTAGSVHRGCFYIAGEQAAPVSGAAEDRGRAIQRAHVFADFRWRRRFKSWITSFYA